MNGQADYKNWVPKGMAYGVATGAAACAAGGIAVWKLGNGLRRATRNAMLVGAGVGLAGLGTFAAWCFYARRAFSYDDERHLSRIIVEGTAERLDVPEGGSVLDVGCGSGALSIAVAKRNPSAHVFGIDYWGPEYASYSRELCESNAAAEGVDNVRFERGDARELHFADETFDAVTSNYVYHNITGSNKQELLRETLRTLKKGGTFAIHDLMGPARYGDMEQFAQSLRNEGYESVELIPTDDGLFMDKTKATLTMLRGSTLLVGRK